MARQPRRRTVLAVALSLCVAALMGGCKKEESSSSGGTSGGASTTAPAGGAASGGGGAKFAFVTNNASEFWKIAAAGVHAYEKEAGVTVTILQPPNGKVEEQNQMLENLVSQGYAGVALSAIAPADQVAEIDAAAKKTKVITFDSDAPASQRLVYIGTDNFKAGQVLGEQIVKLMPEGGKVAVFVGTLSADNAKQRLDGVVAATKDHKIEVVEKREDQTDRNKARSNVEDVLNARPDVTMYVGLWSYNGPAIANAIAASGKKGKVKAAVFDEEDDTLAGVADGTIACTVVQKPYQFGYLSSKMLNDLSKGTAQIPADKKIDTGVQVITKDNVEKFKADLAKMKG